MITRTSSILSLCFSAGLALLTACDSPVSTTSFKVARETALTNDGTVSKEVPQDQGDLIITTSLQRKDTAVIIPAKAFSANSIITVQEGSSLVDQDHDVGKLVVSSVFSRAPAVIISNSKRENPSQAIEVRLPIPEAALRLGLTGVVEDPLKHLIVVYKTINYEGTPIIKAGYLTRDKFEISGDQVILKTLYLGSFQTVITIDLLEKSMEAVAQSGIKSKKNETIVDNPLESQKDFLPDSVFDANTPPAPLGVFTASLSRNLEQGEIRLDIELGDHYTITYEKLSILRLKGAEAPSADCRSDGELIAAWDEFPLKAFTFIDQTGSRIGEVFSYRACIVGQNGQATVSNISRSRAYDTTPPPVADVFQARTGGKLGEVFLAAQWASDVSDYARAEIIEVQGPSAPESLCRKEDTKRGRTVASLSNFAISRYSSAHKTDSSLGEIFSYRLCIYDTFGNFSSSEASARALDNIAPIPLLAFSAATGVSNVGDIDLSWKLPLDLSDYFSIRVLAKAGSQAPGADCSSGDIAARLTSPFPTQYTFATGSTRGEEFSFRVCIQDRAGNLTSSNTVAGIWSLGSGDSGSGGGEGKVAPPLTSFHAEPGDTDGDVKLTLVWPSDVSLYQKVEIRRTLGSSAPSSKCDDGVIIASFASFTGNGQESFVDQTESHSGETFSYRACITDSVSIVKGDRTASSQAFDSIAPPVLESFAAVSGRNHGEIDISMVLPSDVSDYTLLTVRHNAGDRAPSADCRSDGTTTKSFVNVYANQVIAFTHSASDANPPGLFSYRVCIEDSSGNLTSSDQSVAVAARDKQAPPALAWLSASSGSNFLGQMNLSIQFPSSVEDYASLSYKKVEGTNPPIDCSQGNVISGVEANKLLSIAELGAPGRDYAFTICIADRADNRSFQAAATKSNMSASHRIFVTSTLFTGDLRKQSSETSGLAGAFDKCQSRADTAKLGGIWKAILSTKSIVVDESVAIVSSVVNNRKTAWGGPQMVASNEQDLWDGSIDNPLGYSESGDFNYLIKPWTGTNTGPGDDGPQSIDILSGQACDDEWVSQSSDRSGHVGKASDKTYNWLSNAKASCHKTQPLYCIDGQSL